MPCEKSAINVSGAIGKLHEFEEFFAALSRGGFVEAVHAVQQIPDILKP